MTQWKPIKDAPKGQWLIGKYDYSCRKVWRGESLWTNAHRHGIEAPDAWTEWPEDPPKRYRLEKVLPALRDGKEVRRACWGHGIVAAELIAMTKADLLADDWEVVERDDQKIKVANQDIPVWQRPHFITKPGFYVTNDDGEVVHCDDLMKEARGSERARDADILLQAKQDPSYRKYSGDDKL